MIKPIVALIGMLLSFTVQSQSPIGAWQANSTAANGDKISTVVIFADGYQVLSSYNATTGKFMHTNGGTWKLDQDTMTERAEFHSDDSERVGKEVSFKVSVTDDYFQIIGSDRIFSRIDKGEPGVLKGAWLMSGRIRDGETQMRDTSSPRKTMKILSGSRFQWIAYNTETKQFMGTGGGTYTTINGDYVEHIEFFSRDASRVGQSLSFKYEFIDGQWHHSGFSSSGEPIHEIWGIRE